MKMMQNDRPRLSFFPDAPFGATMFARYIAFHRLSGNRTIDQSKLQLFGKKSASPADVFGGHVQKVKDGLPGYVSFDVPKSIKNSTLFGLYSACLPSIRRNLWEEELRW